MTKLESGSIIGSSEVTAVRRFRATHPDSPLRIEAFDDGWIPDRTVRTFQEVRNRDFRFMITSHTSVCAVAIASEVNASGILTLVTGATTDALSGADDRHIRIVPDVVKEQRAAAQAAAAMPGRKLLLLRDLDNDAYTVPGAAAFSQEWAGMGDGRAVRIVDIRTNNLSFPELEALFRNTDYDILYILVGGYRTVAGNIAQLSARHKPEAAILFTPWMRNPDLVDAAGPALGRASVTSHYPARKDAPQVDAYLSSIEKEYGFTPTMVSLKVYEALTLLDAAVRSGARTPEDVKRYLIERSPHATDFGSVELDRFGDASADFFIIDDIAGEFRR